MFADSLAADADMLRDVLVAESKSHCLKLKARRRSDADRHEL
jgi:hypothetical protein